MGSEGEIPALDLIIGISATPERFHDLLRVHANRTILAYEIAADEIRASGLIKDRILLYHPPDAKTTDWTLLGEAIRYWRNMEEAWDKYVKAQDLPMLVPALVIQVEDGTDHDESRTDLAEVVRVLEKEVGHVEDQELAHCFDIDHILEAAGHRIRKIDASDIQDDSRVKYVFFKMALTTGWDCPRAEVMMSFRRAKDDTLIAQLIGRMIRAPLARRIEGRDDLNSVALYLPHYDSTGLAKVVAKLKSDPDSVAPTDVEEGSKQMLHHRSESQQECFTALEGLPTYRIQRVQKVSNVRRLMKLSRLLTMIHEVDLEAWEESRELVVSKLVFDLARMKSEDSEFERNIDRADAVDIRAVVIEQGTWKEISDTTIKVKLNDHNIGELFQKAGQRIGEGLHLDYFQMRYDPEQPNRAKLELILLLQNQTVWDALESMALARIGELFERHKPAIRKLTGSQQEDYNKIREISKQPEPLEYIPPLSVFLPVDLDPESGFKEYPKHLLLGDGDRYFAKLNEWEVLTITAELSSAKVKGWLRNYERKKWALSLPYDYKGQQRATWPDFLVLRETGKGNLEVDILEPHSPHLDDSYAKAKGLAQYAREHYAKFGRIEIIRIVKGAIKRLDLNHDETRRRVLQVDSNAGLDLLFGITKADFPA